LLRRSLRGWPSGLLGAIRATPKDRTWAQVSQIGARLKSRPWPITARQREEVLPSLGHRPINNVHGRGTISPGHGCAARDLCREIRCLPPDEGSIRQAGMGDSWHPRSGRST